MIGVSTIRPTQSIPHMQRGLAAPTLSQVFVASLREAARQTLTQSSVRIFDSYDEDQYIKEKNEEKLTIDQLNEEYGVEGYLTFDKEEYRGRAIALKEKTLRRMANEEMIARGIQAKPLSGIVTSFGAAMMAQLTDPAEIGLSFLPIVGQGKIASIASKTKGIRFALDGIIKKETVAKLANNNKVLTETLTGIIEGGIATTSIEPFVYYAARRENERYNAKDALINISTGTAFGGFLRTVTGLRTLNMVEDSVALASPEARKKAFSATISDIVTNRPDNTAGEILAADASYIKNILNTHLKNKRIPTNERDKKALVSFIQNELLQERAKKELKELNKPNKTSKEIEENYRDTFSVSVNSKKTEVAENVETERKFIPQDEKETELMAFNNELRSELIEQGENVDDLQVTNVEINKVESVTQGILAAAECVISKL